MTQSIHILYMEDNEGTARLLEKRLQRLGYMIDVVPNGEEGLKRCKTESYDIIIVDYDMPGLNGLQVMKRLMDQGNECPIIVLTGTGNERIAVEALKLGAADYMVKDIDGVYFDLLPTTINQALKNQQLLKENQRVQEALRESEARFRMLFERAPNPYFVSDLGGTLLDCNRAVESLFGVEMKDIINKHFSELALFSEQQLNTVADILLKSSDHYFTEPTELDITRPDGQMATVDLRTLPIRMKGQIQILGMAHDVTWRKEAEKQMQRHIKQLETLSRIDDELTRELDIDYVQDLALNNIMSLSNADAGSITLLEDDIVLSVKSIGYPEEAEQYFSLDNRSIVSRVAREQEAEWVRDVNKDPDYIAVLKTVCSQITIPLISQERLVGILNIETTDPANFNNELFEFLKLIAVRIAVAIDNAQLYSQKQRQLIELQDLYDQVSELEELKTDMIRLAAHDLRNPLTSILTSTYLLRKISAEDLTEKQDGHINSIHNAVIRMQKLISDFLSIERIEGTLQSTAEMTTVNLTQLVQHVYQNHEQQAHSKEIAYHLDVVENETRVEGFEIELQQVITNLIGNAIKYTPKGGTVLVKLQHRDAMIEFNVIDSGYGIPDEQQQNLFQPFFRVNSTETQSIEGTGLGLYLAKKFIERNHGEIIFESEHGKGSSFGFKLPVINWTE